MSGIFSSMNTATKGLMAQQTALHTTGHNISNVNTEGYTRQRVDMQADKAFNFSGVGQLGTGVKMEAVVRMINDQVGKQIRTENSTLNRFTEKSDVLDQLEIIFNEPSDTGLSFNISEMFIAFDELAKNPENLNSKTVAVEKLKTLTSTLNHMANQIEGLEGETHEAIDKNVLDFNSKIEQLNSLNKQIFNISIKGQVPNDLLDQRDLMLKELTAIADVDIDFDDYGRVGIKMGPEGGKQDILTKNGTQKYLGYDKKTEAGTEENFQIKLYKDKYDPEDNSGQDGQALVITNGKILGNMDAIKEVKGAAKNLDKLANIMAQAINQVHVNENTDKNKPIFTFKGYKNLADIAKNVTAKNIQINTGIVKDPSILQAGKTKAPGDGSLALDIAKLRNRKISVKEEAGSWTVDLDDKDGNTIGGSYRDIVIKTGISKQHSDNMVDNQIALTNQLEMRRESVSGVALNDEITNVIKFQKAYEANAKVISVLTDMLDVLINRTGV